MVMVWVVVFLGGKGGLVLMFCLVVVVLVVVDVRCTHKSRYCTHTFTFTSHTYVIDRYTKNHQPTRTDAPSSIP